MYKSERTVITGVQPNVSAITRCYGRIDVSETTVQWEFRITQPSSAYCAPAHCSQLEGVEFSSSQLLRKAIRRKRETLGISVDELATVISLDPKHLVAFEEGEHDLDGETWDLLAEALDIDTLAIRILTELAAREECR